MTTTIDFGPMLVSAASSIVKTLARSAKRVGANLVDQFRTNYSDYFSNTINRVQFIRTIISRQDSVDLFSLYTTSFVNIRKRQISDTSLLARIEKLESFVVLGSGGAGKSMLMRWLFLSLVESASGRIPVLFELRVLNSSTPIDLTAEIHKTITSSGGSLAFPIFLKILESGGYILLLDGFDELSQDLRSTIERQIIDLNRSMPNVPIVISSRPDERFNSWGGFATATVQPMRKREVLTLIQRLPYPHDIRTKFRNSVRVELYDRHESFLSNPLLATMMLMTFEQFATIPDRIHVFYEQAFETLFMKHDSTKEAGYQRYRHTDLAINEFKNCFAAFCVSTYLNEKFEFSESEVLEFIVKALTFERSDAKPSLFLRDLIESVCLLQRDGLYLGFTHRSFQEYFVAAFVCSGRAKNVNSILDFVCKRDYEAILHMSYDMNPSLVLREWVLPKLQYLVPHLENVRRVEGPVAVMIALYGTSITVDRGPVNQGEIGIGFSPDESNPNRGVVWGLRALFPGFFDTLYPVQHLTREGDEISDSVFEELRRRALAEETDSPEESALVHEGSTTNSVMVTLRSTDSWAAETWVGRLGQGVPDVLRELLIYVEGLVEESEAATDLLLSAS